MRLLLARERFRVFWILILLVLAATAAWRIGDVATVSAQAQTKVDPKDGLTYVFIPPGTFQMGCSQGDSECVDFEKPAHSVTITKGFWIGQTLVTQAAFMKVTNSNPSNFKGDQLPAETVPWADAQAYCKSVDMRLPTEAEWEYAARGGSKDADYAPLPQIAWYEANSAGMTHDVAKKQANGYGLYDTLGNVWEWVNDAFGVYNASSATDPQGPPVGPTQIHVLRGGSHSGIGLSIRVSARTWMGPGNVEDVQFGFRCAGN